MLDTIRGVFSARELVWSLTLRELKTKYRRSVLGWAWSMLHPLSTVVIYSLVFGVLFQSQAPVGTPSGLESFPMFLLVGILVWGHFALVALLGLNSVTGNSGLVRRVSFPREVLVFSNSLHALVQFLIEITLLVLILLIVGGRPLQWLAVTIGSIALLNLFATGFGLVLGSLSVYFKDLSHLWTVVIQAWFFLTPIVYPPEYVEERAPGWLQTAIDINPMTKFVEMFRQTLYHGGQIDWSLFSTLSVISLISLSFGWWVFLRLSRRFAEEV